MRIHKFRVGLVLWSVLGTLCVAVPGQTPPSPRPPVASGVQGIVIEDAIRAIKTNLVEFDSAVKTGVKEGELQMVSSSGYIGGPKFEKADKVLQQAFALAETIDLQRLSSPLFEELLAYCLLFDIRTKASQRKMSERILKLYNNTLPPNARLNYLFGLETFRAAENDGREDTYDRALAFFNAALKSNPEFPEAYWLRSQIFAHKGNLREKVKADLDSANKYKDRFDPLLYLYDMQILKMITDAISRS